MMSGPRGESRAVCNAHPDIFKSTHVADTRTNSRKEMQERTTDTENNKLVDE